MVLIDKLKYHIYPNRRRPSKTRPRNFVKKHISKKHIPIFSCICSLALAARRVTAMMPHVVIIGAVKRIKNATLLK